MSGVIVSATRPGVTRLVPVNMRLSRLRKALTVLVLSVIGAGGLVSAGPATGAVSQPGSGRPVIGARRDEHDEQPHTP